MGRRQTDALGAPSPEAAAALRELGIEPLAPAPAARYLGAGQAFIGGVPARDLTAEEWGALGEGLRAQCLTTGLYVIDDPAPATPDATQEG